MKCTITTNNQLLIATVITGLIKRDIQSGKATTIEDLCQTLYSFILTETNNTTTALDYARQAPRLIEQLSTTTLVIKKHLREKGVDFNILTDYVIGCAEENGLKYMATEILKLDNNSQSTVIIEALNKEVATNNPTENIPGNEITLAPITTNKSIFDKVLSEFKDLRTLSAEERKELKEKLKNTIDSLPNDMHYFLHETSQDVAPIIFNEGLILGGNSLISTAGAVSKESIYNILSDLIDGTIHHRGAQGAVILAFPYSEFGQSDANNKVSSSTIEQKIEEENGVSNRIPSKYVIGFFTDGIIHTENQSRLKTEQKADIERRRQEELSGEDYRVVVSEEVFEGDDIDNEGDKIRLKIVTNKDGSRTLFIGSKGNLFGEGQGESWKVADKIDKDNTLTNNEYINAAWKGVGENFNTEGSNTVNKTLKSVEVINAKYDAELKALEESTISDSKTISDKLRVDKLYAQMEAGKLLTEFTVEEQGLLADPSLTPQWVLNKRKTITEDASTILEEVNNKAKDIREAQSKQLSLFEETNTYDEETIVVNVDTVQPLPVFEAAKSSILTDTGSEILPGEGHRLENPELKFVYALKRKLLRAHSRGEVHDQGGILLENRRVYLTAMTIGSIPNNEIEGDPNKVVLVLTNQLGQVLRFNPETLSIENSGSAAHYNLFDIDSFLDPSGNLDLISKRTLDKLEAIERKTGLNKDGAIAYLKREIEAVQDIINYVKKNENLLLEITGGSVGRIDNNRNSLSPLSLVTDPTLQVKIKDKLPKATTSNLYGEYLPLELPAIENNKFEQTIISLLVDPIVDSNGKPITAKKRKEALGYFINIFQAKEYEGTTTKLPIFGLIPDSKDPIKYSLYLGEPFPINNAADRQKALVLITELIAQKRKSSNGTWPMYKLHVNKHHLQQVNVITPLLTTKNDVSTLTWSKQKTKYVDFLKELGVQIATVDIGSDGTLKRMNAYFTFKVENEAAAEMYKEIIEKETKETTDSIASTKEASPLHHFDAIQRDIEFKNRYQKTNNTAVTVEEINTAREWFNQSPLADKIEFEALFHLVNSVDRNAVAQWTLSGITLFKGSDYTDLYHEAWHGFSQLFMNHTQREELYESLRKKKGDFKDHNLNVVAYSNATDKQLEEHLAESFREYMLNGQKPISGTPKQTSLFRKIWQVLKALFSEASLRESILDPKVDAKAFEIFEKLKVGNLKDYTFSYSNTATGQLNKGIVSVNEQTGASVEFTYQETHKINNWVNSFIGEYIDWANSELNPKEMHYVSRLESEIAEGIRNGIVEEDVTKNGINYMSAETLAKKQAELQAYGLRRTARYSGQITKNEQILTQAYQFSKLRIEGLIRTLTVQIAETEDPSEKQKLNNNLRLLNLALTHFGNTEDIKANRLSDGIPLNVIGYHMHKTELFQSSDMELEDGDTNEDNAFLKKNTMYDRNGQDVSLLEASHTDVLFILKTLPGYVLTKEGNQREWIEDRDEIGVRNINSFTAIFGRLARALDGSNDYEVMYKRLEAMAITYPAVKILLHRLGSPNRNRLDENGLWSHFYAMFNKKRVSLIQAMIKETKHYDENKKYTHSTFDSTIGEAFNADFTIGKMWDNALSSALPGSSQYITNTPSGNELNVKAITDKFSTDPRVLAKNDKMVNPMNDPFQFFEAIGLRLTDVQEIRDALSATDAYNPSFFLQAIVNATTPIRSTKFFENTVGTRYKDLQKLEAMYSDTVNTFMVTNAEGNTQFEHSLNNSLIITVNSVNEANTYDELLAMPHMRHMDIRKTVNGEPNLNYNPLMSASRWLRSVYALDDNLIGTPDWGVKRTDKNKNPVRVRITNLSGVLIDETDKPNKGVASASADSRTKLILDIHLSLAGYPELMRHADKGTSFAITIDGPLDGNSNSSDNYINLDKFQGEENEEMYQKMLPYLIAEMERMRIMRNLNTEEVKDYDFSYVESGKEFHVFKDIFTDGTKFNRNTKEELLKIVASTNDIAEALNDEKLTTLIKADIAAYFQIQFENTNIKFGKASFISDNIKTTVIRKGIPSNAVSDTLVKFHVYNNWLHNIESLTFLYGDLALYDQSKEDFHKRNAGSGSTGTLFRTDRFIQNFLNSDIRYEESYGFKNSDKLGITRNPYEYKGQLKTAILSEVVQESIYHKELLDIIPDLAHKYLDQKEADAQGFITFDAYRILKIADGSWTKEHQDMYIKIVNEQPIDDALVNKFFPVIKAQYWGNLNIADSALQQKQHLLPITAFHKYSLFPMIPSVVKNKNLEHLHNRMVKEGISYVTFKTGSKVGTLTKDSTKKNDTLYVKDRELDPAMTDITRLANPQDALHFTPNIIYMQYLKNQLEIDDAFKDNVIFSTQLRKLVEDGLFENGVPVDFEVSDKDINSRKLKWDALSHKLKLNNSDNYKLIKAFENNLEALTDLAKKKLLKELQWESEITPTGEKLTGDIQNLLSLVHKELNRQNLGEHAAAFFNVDINGNLQHDASLSINADAIEKALNALMVKRLIKQKVKGNGLIQVATTLMEDSKPKFTNPTPEERRRYIGTNDLPFYIGSEEQPTKAMKVKVALTGDYLHLLNALDLDGNKIKTRKRLNELIRDDEWLNTGRNREMVTMIAVRIPVQGLNSMEFMEVYEFLPAVAGSIIIAPTEVVTKSGSDFDVDKMTVLMPNIALIGDVPTLFNTGSSTSSVEDLTTERKTLFAKIKEENIKYDEAFERRAAGDKFSFTVDEEAELDKINVDLRKLNRTIEEKTKAWSNLSRIYQSPSVRQSMSLLQEELDTLEEEYASKERIKIHMLDHFDENLVQQRADTIKVYEDRLSQVQLELNSISAKAIQNNILSNLKDILSLPSNYKSLITPNSTSIYTEKDGNKSSLVDETAPTAMDFNPRENVMSTKVENKGISGTRVLEINYNLYKHESNNIGKQTLGLGAVDNTYNTLFNRVGAYMNPMSMQNVTHSQYIDAVNRVKENRYTTEQKALKKRDLVIKANYTKQTILLPHNKLKDPVTGQDAISLSHLKDADDKYTISDVVNQLMNGWVDIAKDAWIFNIQGNKEVAPVLLFMIQAGVPVREAVYLVSNPLIREYIQEQQAIKSTFAAPLGKAPKDETHFRSEARKAIIKKYKLMSGDATSANINVYANEVLGEHPGFDLNNLKQRGLRKIGSPINDFDRDVFLHYMQLEEMAKVVRDIKMRTNVDTSRDMSLFAAKDRLDQLGDLKQNERFPSHVLTNLEKDSPISSFFIQDFQINLLGKLFTVRASKVFNDFVDESFSVEDSKKTYPDRDIAISVWQNNLINYLFQNELKSFNINKIKSYNNRTIDFNISNTYNEMGAYVENGKLKVDVRQLREDYKNAIYTKVGYHGGYGKTALSRDTFTGHGAEQEYIHYVIERETYRYTHPLTKELRDSKKFIEIYDKAKVLYPKTTDPKYDANLLQYAYEIYISDQALDRIFNHWKIFRSNRTMAHQFLQIKGAFGTTLPNTLGIFNVLDYDTNKENQGSTGVYHNLKINNSQLTGSEIDVYHENINQLKDFTFVRNLLDKGVATDQDIIDINEFFDRFEINAFLQSGMSTKSIFSLVSFVSQDKMLRLLEKPVKKLKQIIEENGSAIQEYLEDYTQVFKQTHAISNRNSRIRGANMFNGVSLLDEHAGYNQSRPALFLEEIGIETDNESQLYRVNSNVAAENLILNNPDAIFVYNLAKDNTEGTKVGDYHFHGKGAQTIGLTSLLSYSAAPLNRSYIKDLNGTIDPVIKEAIDNDIAQMVEAQQSHRLVFSKEGYGQTMLEKTIRGETQAKETFLYLSKALMDNFGYINPGFVTIPEGVGFLKTKTDVVTKEEIHIKTNNEVDEFIKRCYGN